MADTIKIPAIGPVKTTYAYAAAALVLGIVGYAYWARSRGGSDSGSTVYGIDPATGSATGSDAYTNPDPSDPDDYDEPPAAPRNNVEWTQRVLELLITVDPGFVSTTIGRYLDRQPLTTDEANVVRQAWSLVGKPPEGPPTFTLVSTGGSPGTGNPIAPGAPRNLRVFQLTNTSITLDWDEPSDATKPVGGYNVWVTTGPDKGAVFKTKDTLAVLLGRTPDTAYAFRVEAFDPTDKVVSPSVTVSARTKK